MIIEHKILITKPDRKAKGLDALTVYLTSTRCSKKLRLERKQTLDAKVWQLSCFMTVLREIENLLQGHDQINIKFRPYRFLLSAKSYRHVRLDVFNEWDDDTMEMAV